MPVYLLHWRDGDCSLTAANNREEAAAHFQNVACVEPDTIYEMQAPDLTVTLSLTDFGKLSVEDFTPVLKEMRQVCYPELVETLERVGYWALAGQRPHEEVQRVVRDLQRLRPRSKLSQRLINEARQARRRGR